MQQVAGVLNARLPGGTLALIGAAARSSFGAALLYERVRFDLAWTAVAFAASPVHRADDRA